MEWGEKWLRQGYLGVNDGFDPQPHASNIRLVGVDSGLILSVLGKNSPAGEGCLEASRTLQGANLAGVTGNSQGILRSSHLQVYNDYMVFPSKSLGVILDR